MTTRQPHRLAVADHDRGSTGMHYVYAVVSRRSRGVSVGINLEPNNACNWRCIYCQVPELVYGKGPPVDLPRLEAELSRLLDDIAHGDFLRERAPEGMRRLNDVAFSGNGEPTTSPHFAESVAVAKRCIERAGFSGRVELVLITNGSMLGKARVRDAVASMCDARGQVWFKLDSATPDGIARVNGHAIDPAAHIERLRQCAELCDTWIQTCVFELDGRPPSEQEQRAYLDAVASLRGSRVKGVLLYSLARASMQPEASRLAPVTAEWLRTFAARIDEHGLPVRAVP